MGDSTGCADDTRFLTPYEYPFTYPSCLRFEGVPGTRIVNTTTTDSGHKMTPFTKKTKEE